MSFHVGQRWRSQPKAISDETLHAFSIAMGAGTGYGSPTGGGYHGDSAAARAQGWRSAVGWALMPNAYVGELLVGTFGVEAVSSSAEINLAFTRPVYAGDTITAHLSIRSVEQSVDRRTRLTLDAWCENQAGEKVVVGAAALAP